MEGRAGTSIIGAPNGREGGGGGPGVAGRFKEMAIYDTDMCLVTIFSISWHKKAHFAMSILGVACQF